MGQFKTSLFYPLNGHVTETQEIDYKYKSIGLTSYIP